MLSDSMVVQIVLTILLIFSGVVLVILRRFRAHGLTQVREIFQQQSRKPARLVSEEDLRLFPPLLQKHLRRVGIVGKPYARTVRLRQYGNIRTGEKDPWMRFEADEYFSVDLPSLDWFAVVWKSGLIPLAAWDSLRSSKGRMIIKLCGFLQVVDGQGPEIDQGSLMRYLNETMWFPSALLNPAIRWEEQDANHLKASLSVGAVQAEAVLEFNGDGDLLDFRALRQRDLGGGKYAMTPWSTPVEGWKEMNGLRLPTRGMGVWHLDSGEFPYIRLEVRDVEINPPDVFK